MPSLVEPTVAVPESFLAAMREFADEGRAGDDTMVGRDLVNWGDQWEADEGFAAHVRAVVRDREEDASRAPGWVPCTTRWWVDGIANLGRIAIRHPVTPARCERSAGTSVRRAPLGAAAGARLRDARRRAAGGRRPGIDPALVTCGNVNL